MTRRKFLKGLIPVAVFAAAQLACDDASKRRSDRRNRKLKRRGDDWVKPGDGKGWGDGRND